MTSAWGLATAMIWLALYLAGARVSVAESFTTNLVDGIYTNSAGPCTIGLAGPSNALIILNGGRLDATVSIIGSAAGARQNSAYVSGAGSQWNNTSALYIGQSGSANCLWVTDGGRVDGNLSILGLDSTSTGNQAEISGPNSVWSCYGGLHIGESGSSNQVRLVGGGRVFSAEYASVGHTGTSSQNSLVVSGSGSALIHSGTFSVGAFGAADNRAAIREGASLYSLLGAVGNGAGNRMLLSDAGTFWQVDGLLWVGRGGQGNQLTITNRAHVSSLSAVIGGINNLACVTGTGSVWDTGATRAQLVVGDSGYSNQLVIADGGQVISWNGVVAGNSNLAQVVGHGAQWLLGDTLWVGEEFDRADQLMVLAGGQVRSRLATLSGDNGSIVVTGAESLLKADGWVGVGDETGAGNRLSIADGGRVSSGVGYIGGLTSAFNPHGRNVDNAGIVTGLGSVWDNTSNLVVGATGSGSQLTISEGGRVTNEFGYLGFYASAFNCQVWISDANSLWHNRGDLFIGYQSSGDRLVVTNRGRVDSASGFVGSRYNRDNTALVTGSGSRWHLDSGLVVGNAGFNNLLTVAAGAWVDCAAGYLDAPFDANPGVSNSVVVTGTNSLFSIAGTLAVGLSSSVNELRIENGATVSAGSLVVGGAATLNNLLTVAGGNLYVTNTGNNGLLDLGRAAATLTGGIVEVDRLAAGPRTTVSLAAGTLTVNQEASLASGQTFTVGAESSTAQLWLGPGSHSFAGGLRVESNSAFTAAGTVSGNVSNAGTLAIGSPIGSLTLNGDLGLADSAVALFELGGPAQSGRYDFIRVTNAVRFGGLLRVALINGYRPASNDLFTLMRFGAGTGSFLNVASGARLVLEGSDVSARADYTGTVLRLSEFFNANPATNEIDPAWALRYFGHTPLTEEEKQADADGDGLKNAEEYWAGTDPLDPTSVLRFTSIRREVSGEMVLRFFCVAGKGYFMAYSTDLVSWVEVGAPAFTTPAPGICEWIDDGSQTVGSPAGARRAYRVGIR